MQFEFATATRIVFGAGAIHRVGADVKAFGARALVVTGRNPHRAEPLLAGLRANGQAAVPFAVAGEPEISTVEQGVARARAERCDFVIALGGGSVMDAGKAIAAMLANAGALRDYLEIIGRGQALTQPSAPFVAIPTTAGTGAEVTRNAVLASPEHRLKVSLRSPLMLPRLAVVDPELTYDLPPALTASTGLDALTQLIEPYVCLRANPLTDGLCGEGLRRAAYSLRVVFKGASRNAAFRRQGELVSTALPPEGGVPTRAVPLHEEQFKSARADMAIASLHGGLALANAGLGAVHGFAGPIGGMFPAPHGAVCAALLPHVMAANLGALRAREPKSYALRRYWRIASLLSGNPNATADAGVEWVRELVAELAIPPLRAYGIGEAHVAELVEKARNASSMKANPIVLTPEELAAVLRAAL